MYYFYMITLLLCNILRWVFHMEPTRCVQRSSTSREHSHRLLELDILTSWGGVSLWGWSVRAVCRWRNLMDMSVSDSAQLGIGLRCSHSGGVVLLIGCTSHLNLHFILLSNDRVKIGFTLPWDIQRNETLFYCFPWDHWCFSFGRTIGSYSYRSLYRKEGRFVGLASVWLGPYHASK